MANTSSSATDMNDKSCHELTYRKQRFVSALLTHHTLAAAAAAAGVSERTAFRYVKDAAVRRALFEAQQELLRTAAQRALSEVTRALEVLAEIACSPAAPPPSRVAAAKAILEAATRLYDVASLSERVRLLEQKVLGVLNNEDGQTGAADREA